MLRRHGRVALWAISVLQVMAAVTPTSPGPNDVFRVGGTCTTQWDLDTTG